MTESKPPKSTIPRRPGRPQVVVPTPPPPATPRPIPKAPSTTRSGGLLGEMLAKLDADDRPTLSPPPRAFDPEKFLGIPERQRVEVRNRAAMLVQNGRHPHEALQMAAQSVNEDENTLFYDMPFDWSVIAAITDECGQVRDTLTRRPDDQVFYMAGVIENLARAEIDEPGAAEDVEGYFAAFGLDPVFLSACVNAFQSRLAARRLELEPPTTATSSNAETSAEEPKQVVSWWNEESMMKF